MSVLLRNVCTYCASVEVLLDRENESLVLRDPLDLVSPFARNLDSGLDSLCAGVHGQDHVETEERRCVLGEAWEHIVVECTTAQCQS